VADKSKGWVSLLARRQLKPSHRNAKLGMHSSSTCS